MKISLRWLADYVDVADFFVKPQELSQLLTAAGLEVESVADQAKQFESVVIGHILERGQHPNADRLTLCQVSTGEGVVHQIVCGATNHKKDDRVVVALPGAILPGDFAIKKSKIRGVESGGMLCSEVELGLKAESEGILILSPDAPIGQSFAKYMGLDDVLFEIKVTPNRADCLSHFGLAREIACILGREYRWPLESLIEEGKPTTSVVALDVKSIDLCPRYAGRLMTGVKVGPSPDWLKKRLESIGVKSINNVVDITNFVMMEMGQPLHAFDLRELKGSRIEVSLAREGEPFVSLDGTEHRLSGDELTIRDGERVVALAGIVGGKNSGIQDDTTDLFIESAYFNPTTVRKTSRKLKIDTDSSYRFARGTNPEAVPLAMNRAAQLIQKVAGGKISGDPHDFYPRPLPKREIRISLEILESRLGYKVTPPEFEDWMRRLGCEINSRGVNDWAVVPPLFRHDLNIDMDLVEEFARLHGYQHIPESLPPADLVPSDHDPAYLGDQKIRRLLTGQGLHQAINYGFLSAQFQDELIGDPALYRELGMTIPLKPVSLVNPLNAELAVMRTSLLPGLIRNVIHNSRQGNSVGRLFEVGYTFLKAEAAYQQQGRLGLAFWGAEVGLWQKAAPAPLVFQLKGAIENLLRSLGVTKWKWQPVAPGRSLPPLAHPGQTATLQVEGKAIGFIATLHPVVCELHKIREPVAVAELNIDKWLSSSARSLRTKSISKFPAVERDLAFVVPKSVLAADVEAVLRQNGGDILQDVQVFDVFEGGSLAPGQRSVGFRLSFQDLKATLEDAKVNAVRDAMVLAAQQKLGLSLR